MLYVRDPLALLHISRRVSTRQHKPIHMILNLLQDEHLFDDPMEIHMYVPSDRLQFPLLIFWKECYKWYWETKAWVRHEVQNIIDNASS